MHTPASLTRRAFIGYTLAATAGLFLDRSGRRAAPAQAQDLVLWYRRLGRSPAGRQRPPRRDDL